MSLRVLALRSLTRSRACASSNRCCACIGAYFVVALNHDMSVSSIIDPIKKIEALLASRMSRHVFRNAVTAEDVVDLYKQNRETKA